MKCVFRQYVQIPEQSRGRGFTLVEIVAALAILVGIVSTVLVVMNNAVEATIEMRSRQHAFEVARDNLESLLTTVSVSDMAEYGDSEKYPEIHWELRVEPFYEPISNKMWIRAVSIAGFTDSQDQEQTVELQEWLTGLTAQQIKQILNQQKTEEEILEALYGEEDTELQELTKQCLRQSGLNVSVYEKLLQEQRREKLDYLLKNDMNFDQGFDELLEVLDEEEAQCLETLGVDFDQLDDCINQLIENPTVESGEKPGPESAEDPCQAYNCQELDAAQRQFLCQELGCCCE